MMIAESLWSQPAVLAALLIAAAATITDLRTRTVPNGLVLAGGIAGFGLNCWSFGFDGLRLAALGFLTGFCVFLPFYLLRGMGGGDVKLMGALGSCLGALPILQTALIASIAGAVLALTVAARHGALARTFAGTGRLLASWARRGPRPSAELTLENPNALKIPYAVPIAVGAFGVVLSGVMA